ncbi:MAG: hypothetical protein ACR2NP_19340 [Pirellulaceae bacterium]
MLRYTIAPVLFCCLYASAGCTANIVETGPFTGDQSEDFTEFQGGAGGYQTLDIFGSAVTINNLTDGGAIKIEFSSTLIVGGQSDTVVPRSNPVFMGQLGILEWDFHQPVSRFGGYFENNSYSDNVTFEFFDVNDNLIGSVVGETLAASDMWTWNGWESTIPIHRAVSTGNAVTLLNGFIWYDDMEITFATIPEPASGLLAGLVVIAGCICRSRRNRGVTVSPNSLWQGSLPA